MRRRRTIDGVAEVAALRNQLDELLIRYAWARRPIVINRYSWVGTVSRFDFGVRPEDNANTRSHHIMSGSAVAWQKRGYLHFCPIDGQIFANCMFETLDVAYLYAKRSAMSYVSAYSMVGRHMGAALLRCEIDRLAAELPLAVEARARYEKEWNLETVLKPVWNPDMRPQDVYAARGIVLIRRTQMSRRKFVEGKTIEKKSKRRKK